MSVLKYKDPKSGQLKPLTTYIVGGTNVVDELGESPTDAISQRAVTEAINGLFKEDQNFYIIDCGDYE